MLTKAQKGQISNMPKIKATEANSLTPIKREKVSNTKRDRILYCTGLYPASKLQ